MGDDGYRSAQFKRGIVRENDPRTGRSKIEVVDEDGTQSFWLAWNMPAAGASKVFNQPDLGSQVNVLLDRHGEDGVILGARYSQEDKPPTENGQILKALLEGGFNLEYDKGAGTLTLNVPNGTTISAGPSRVVIKPDSVAVIDGAGFETLHKDSKVRVGGEDARTPVMTATGPSTYLFTKD